ncbi:hypothetical protein D9619_009243 [Psilocybe cf. subviscida]|uniref:Uncharacterized protein n=1 Tax=Psilocybe cf. subviscida TaxID=2480587 RepID=A0A8H5BUR4_9AGAR|nr:hypothetical protein D9619_009243 [Psilocybe cf. subviscida]
MSLQIDENARRLLIHNTNNDAFNSVVVEAILYGLYAALFWQALWRLFRKTSNNWYMIALTFVWIFSMAGFALSYLCIRNAFIMDNTSPYEITLSLGRPGIYSVAFATLIFSSILADGILIWRCATVWDGDRRVLLFLSYMLLTKIAFGGWSIFSVRSPSLDWAHASAIGFENIIAAGITLSETALIAVQINQITRKSPNRSSYRRIVRILVESAVLYSAPRLIVGIFQLLFLTNSDLFGGCSTIAVVINQAGMLIYTISLPMTGIAPTLIAFRLAEEKSQTDVDETNTLSCLTFRGSRPTQGNSTEGGIISALQFERHNINASVVANSTHRPSWGIKAQNETPSFVELEEIEHPRRVSTE